MFHNTDTIFLLTISFCMYTALPILEPADKRGGSLEDDCKTVAGA